MSCEENRKEHGERNDFEWNRLDEKIYVGLLDVKGTESI